MFYIWVHNHAERTETFYMNGCEGCPRTFDTREEAEHFLATGHPAQVPAHSATYTVHEGDPLLHGQAQSATYPIDPTRPLELEDGTPVAIVTDEGVRNDAIRVRLLADPTGHFPWRGGTSIWVDNVTGHLTGCSDPTYLRVRNVADGRPPLPAWKVKATFADRQRPSEAQVPWKAAEWNKGEAAEVHFPHLAMEGDVPMVAFYASEQHAERERLTKMRPGRYLKRYFGEVLDNEEIERLTAEVTVRAGAMTVRWTQDADEIETIYVNGPSSCMSEDADEYLGHCHPSRVYAGPDLAVAWLGDMNDATARCVVWPERKQYGTIYGDCSRMRLLLEEQGYENGDFEGARFRRIRDLNGNGLIIPYLDFGGARDDGEYLIANAGYLVGSYVESGMTCGTTEDNSRYCGRCGDRVSEDDIYYIEDIEEDYCEHCEASYTARCDYSGDRFRYTDNVVEVHGSRDYTTVHVNNLERAGFVLVTAGNNEDECWHSDCVFTCDDCGEVFHEDDRASAEVDRCEDCEEARDVPPADLLELEAAGQLRMAWGGEPVSAPEPQPAAANDAYGGKLTVIERDSNGLTVAVHEARLVQDDGTDHWPFQLSWPGCPEEEPMWFDKDGPCVRVDYEDRFHAFNLPTPRYERDAALALAA